MPPLNPVPHTLRVVFNGTYGAAKWANVMHVDYTGPTLPNTSDLNTVATNLFGYYQSDFMPLVSGSATLLGCTVTDLNSSSGAVGFHAGSAAGGRGTGSNMSSNVALCLSWKQVIRYRGGHPRTYLCGMEGNDLTDTDHFNATYVGLAKTAMSAFLANVNGMATPSTFVPYRLGYVKYVANKVVLTNPTFLPFVGYDVNSRVDTQRRRLGRV